MHRTARGPCLFLLAAVTLAGCAGCGGARAATEASPAPPPAPAGLDRAGPHAGVPDLTLPETERHQQVRQGLKARLSFVRGGDERPDLLGRMALDHLEEAEEADRAAFRIEDWMAEEGPYPEAQALHARLVEQARTNRAEAVLILEAVTKEFPRHEHADATLFSLATALAQSGRRDEALAIERRLVEDHPDSEYVPDALLDLGDAAFDAMQLVDAKARYEAVRAHPRASVRPFATYKLAWVHWNLSDLAGAAALLAEVARLPLAGADDPLATLRRAARNDYAALYAHIGLPDEAPAHFHGLAGADAARLLVRVAETYAAIGKVADARALWGHLLEETAPCDPAALDWLRHRVKSAAVMGRRALFLEDADAWVARLKGLETCAPPSQRGAVAARRGEGVDAFREQLTIWRRELPMSDPGLREDLARLEAIVESLDPEDPPPPVR